jgi:UDP-N-acetylglucosamine acyltransferase
MVKIHPTAIVDSGAQIGENVSIGPYSVISGNVEIGDNCQIGTQTVILPGARIGRDCKIFHHAVISEIPQDLKFAGEETTAEVGDRTVIREFVTINRGTSQHWRTVVGSDCLLMAYVHVAHDCIVGNHVIMANAVNLAGHVEVEDWVIIGGMVGVLQFSRIGQHSIIGGQYRVSKDVPPYIMAAREPLSYEGLNRVGLKRRNFPSETILALKRAYNLIYNSEYNVSDAIRKIEETPDLMIPEVRNIIEFIRKSSRGII